MKQATEPTSFRVTDPLFPYTGRRTQNLRCAPKPYLGVGVLRDGQTYATWTRRRGLARCAPLTADILKPVWFHRAMPEAQCILQSWHRPAGPASSTTIVPDGCRDLIVVEDGSGHRRAFVSPIDRAPRQVHVEARSRVWGLRLRPGTRIRGALSELARCSESDVTRHLASMTERPQNLEEAFEALAHSETVRQAAQSCGVSERSFRRWFKKHEAETPQFFLQLQRVRRAARVVARWAGEAGNLADIALDFGYADQAHMTRAFRRWLGQTPAALASYPNPLLFSLGVGDGDRRTDFN